MSASELAKRGLMYGFFGSMGADVYKKAKRNLYETILIAVAVMCALAVIRVPMLITLKTAWWTKLMAIVLSPLYAIAGAVTWFMLFYLVSMGIGIAIGSEPLIDFDHLVAQFTPMIVGLESYASKLGSGALKNAFIAYVIAIPLLLPGMVLGAIYRNEDEE